MGTERGDHVDHPEDFSEYASARWGALVRSAVFLGCNTSEAQDLAQTTLTRCYAHWNKVSRADDRDAYVYRVLLNCHRDNRRRRWWQEKPTSVLPDAARADGTDAIDTAQTVHQALSGLSKPNRDVVVLRYFADLSEQQTSHALGIAPGTVKSRLSRALAQLSQDTDMIDLVRGGTS